MVKLKAKIPAATLLEVIVAMVIILIVFTLAIGIYTRVTNSGSSLTHKKAQLTMQQLIRKKAQQQNWEEQIDQFDQLIYHQTAQPYQHDPDLMLIKIEALDNGNIVETLQQVVRVKVDEK